MKIEGKFIFKVAGTLTAISLVVALLLGLTNMLTADKIAAINKQKTEEALAKVVSAADCEFPPMEEIPQAMIDAANEQGGKLSEVYEVQSGGDTIGYAFKVTASGSQGNIVMIVGVDTDLTVTGVSIVKASETAGIGSKVIDNEATSAGTGALDQFVGKSGAGTLVVKQNIDAVTGATVSTKGVTKGVNAALAAAEAMEKPVSKALEEIMENRRAVRTDSGSRAPRPVESAEDHAIAVAAPILAEGDVLGCVMFLSHPGSPAATDLEFKLAQTVAGFLGRQMEG